MAVSTGVGIPGVLAGPKLFYVVGLDPPPPLHFPITSYGKTFFVFPTDTILFSLSLSLHLIFPRGTKLVTSAAYFWLYV